MFKLLSYKFLVCLELPGKANLHNCPWPALVRLKHLLTGWWDLEDKVRMPQQTANGCVYRGMGKIWGGKLNDLYEMER